MATRRYVKSNPKEPTANALSMLLANLAKSPSTERLITLERNLVPDLSVKSKLAITQLIEIYNLGQGWNKDADYDYLAYVFGDLAKYPSFTAYLTTPPSTSPLDPLTHFLPHTTHSSPPRRLGTALLLRNLALSHPDPLYLLEPAHSVLPPLLLPLCSSNQDGITEEEMELLPEECQLLPPEHQQERNAQVLGLEVETLYLLAARGGREERRVMREQGVYIVVRQVHLEIEDKAIRRWCEKIVDLLLGDGGKGQNGGGNKGMNEIGKVAEVTEDEDEEDRIVPIF
ncbi:MAG: hypothetical protein Q9164_001159 [Protoblastenia rupestris]